jgi:hypothetical protein
MKINLEKTSPTFAQLFRFLKIKSGFNTISHFANTLAEDGFAYNDSLFSHWQRGSRTPTNRKLLLALIKIFIKTGSIKYESQANLLLNSAKKRGLAIEEKLKLPSLKDSPIPNKWIEELRKFGTTHNDHKKPKSEIDNNKPLRFNFILPSDIHLYFEETSKTNHISKADFLRKLIRDHKNSNITP